MPEANSNTARNTQPEDQASGEITPELVRKIARQVYAMLVADLRIENERARRSTQRARKNQGGRSAF